MTGASCPRCSHEIALHDGRPVVTATGAVELWHASCFAVRDSRPVEIVTVVAPPQRSPRQLVAIAGAAIVALLAVTHWARAGMSRDSGVGLANADVVEVRETLALPARVTSHDDVAPRVDPTARYPVPAQNGVPLDELYPSLREWAHPVTDA